MASTKLIAKVVGPVLLLRALSIAADREHFVAMLRGLDTEVGTISFSMIPIFLMMGFLTVALTQSQARGLAGLLVRLMGWGGALKAAGLILFPHAMVAKAQLLGQAGFLNVVLAMCLLVGAYFTWFGYFPSGTRAAEGATDGTTARA